MPNTKKTGKISTMKHYIQKFITFIIFFFLASVSCFASEPLKINELVFDNSDNIIFINSKGITNEENSIIKGYLKDPDRVYIDINNAILTTPKKIYEAKYSSLNNVKISQFTVEPAVVRIVFEYNKNLDLSAFQIYKAGSSFFIQLKKPLVNSQKYKAVYSNTKAKDRISFFKGAKYEEMKVVPVSDITLSENTPKNEITSELTGAVKKAEIINPPQSKLSSKYYIDSITKTKNGIIINGIGKLSLMPSFILKEPDRLIIDLDDTVVSGELRNKSFPIGELQNPEKDERETIKLGQNSQSIARLVIQGQNAKDYRGIISPDSKNLYLTNKANIIETKMSDNNANLTKTSYSNLKGIETLYFAFDDSVAFNTFEENSKLYLDINNLNTYDDGILDPIKRALPELSTTRLALDKLRIIIPNAENKNINIKTNPDNTELRIVSKTYQEIQKQKEKEGSVFVPVDVAKKKKTEISNLFKVVIDAGHGGSDVGATRDNIYEKDITLKIAKMVEKNLNKKKIKTYMVRDKDKTVSLQERSDYSNEIKPDLFVSIHVNSSTNDTSYGIETHWYKEDSKKYAQYVHKEMAKKVKDWKTVDRGLFNSKFYVINHTDAPAILCEIGFISNKEEREKIITVKRQEEIAEAVSNGICNYLKAKK